MDVRQRWVTPLMAGGPPFRLRIRLASGSWQLTLHTPLLKNKDVSLQATHATHAHYPEHCHKSREHLCRHMPAHIWSYNMRPAHIRWLCKPTRAHRYTQAHPWKPTPFGTVTEESYINDSDRLALRGQLSANTIQQGHLDSKLMTEGADRLTESDTDQIGSFSSRLLCTRWSFPSIMTYQAGDRHPCLTTAALKWKAENIFFTINILSVRSVQSFACQDNSVVWIVSGWQCQSVLLFLVQTEIYQGLLNRLPWNLVQTLKFLQRGWSLLTSVILWLFIYCHNLVDMFSFWCHINGLVGWIAIKLGADIHVHDFSSSTHLEN